MEPQRQSRAPEVSGENNTNPSSSPDQAPSVASIDHHRDFSWVFAGDDGLRSGWSAFLFVALYYLVTPVLDVIAVTIYPPLAEGIFSPFPVFVSELIPVVALLGAGLLMARIEHRRLVDYNLVDSRRLLHFVGGLLAGFLALSVLVATLALGGWIRFGPTTLHTAPALKYGMIWACAFLLVGFFEEGSFRSYLLSTLTRGINFWWALATVGALCLVLFATHDPKGSGGVFLASVLGVVPCWLLHRSRAADSSFWQAAWATSTAFGYFHTSNNGENWIGIFAASLIGFAFCVSVRITGSAWWAIGCHAAWDWAETYFYGTPDSGFVAQSHLLATRPAGNTLWSGGTDGPEGSLLVVPIILLLLAALLLVYRKPKQVTLHA